jgi:outer membrane protein assembly factor BamB
MLRLLNLDNLSGQGGPGHTGGAIQVLNVPQGGPLPGSGEVLTQPAVWVNPRDGSTWTFVGSNHGLSGLRLSVDASGTPSLTPMWSTTAITSTSPLVANNVLYVASSGHVRALDPTGGRILWQDTSIGQLHMASPIVVNGVLYIADKSRRLSAYGP